MPHKFSSITYVKPTNVSIAEIAESDKDIAYSALLKKLWAYWKANKLTHSEKVKS